MTLVAVPGPNLRRVPTVDGVIFLLTENMTASPSGFGPEGL
jgi:hypothetical protein